MTPLADRTRSLMQSDIRAITHLIREHGGINLGQGICDMPTPDAIKAGAHAAIDGDRSIYSHYAGIAPLRDAIAKKAALYNRIPVTGPDQVVVSVGSTGAFVSALMALLNPGDGVVLFEPFYGYHRNLLELLGHPIQFSSTSAPDWALDLAGLEASLLPSTRAILVNTPSNPSGKVWTRAELEGLLDIATRHDLVILTDEIYEYMLYDGRDHVSLASIPGAFERTVTISGFSKTYNMTGWRLGYAVGPAEVMEKMGLINDLLYICAPTPLQYGVAEAFSMDPSYFEEMGRAYTQKREMMCRALETAGFRVPWPEGSYYVLADFSPLADRFDGFESDTAAARTLVERAGVGSVAGRSFFEDPADGRTQLRFCFAKELPVLEKACRQLIDAFG